MENEQLVWQALLTMEIWMCSMVLLMGDLEEGRQQRSDERVAMVKFDEIPYASFFSSSLSIFA